MTLKIGHFLNYLMEGGTPNMVLSLIANSRHEHTYITFSANDRRRQEFADKGIELIEIGSDDITEAIELARNFDIWHCQNSGGPEPGVYIGISADKPVVETCQSPSYPQGNKHGGRVYVVAVSEGILHHWPEELRPHRVIYSCADRIDSKHNKAENKARFGLSPDLKVVGRLGRLEGIKRPADFLGAVEAISRDRPDIQYLLVGDGNDGHGVRKMASRIYEQHGVAVQMPGFLIGADKADAYGAMDVLLYPTSMEGFGIVFAEAMSIGLPIVTYSDPVNVDVVRHAGLFVSDNVYAPGVHKPFDALGRATIDLLENEREWHKLSKAGLRLYEERYTPARMAKEYDDLYEEIIS